MKRKVLALVILAPLAAGAAHAAEIYKQRRQQTGPLRKVDGPHHFL